MSEQVNHPAHYQQAGKKECIEQMREDYGDKITAIFCLTNAYKYLYRAGAKEGNPKEQDIEKAIWYYKYAKCKLYYTFIGKEDIDYDLRALQINVEKELKKYDRDIKN